MITSMQELAAANAAMQSAERAACLRKLGRPAPEADASEPAIIPLHRGFVVRQPDPLPEAPLREFVATSVQRNGIAQERTLWATCSMEAMTMEVERLAREGARGARIEVRPMPVRGAA